MPFFLHIATSFHSVFKSRDQLMLEHLALRQQLAMLKPSLKRPRVSSVNRLFWILFSKYVHGWRAMLHALHPDTVVRWHRKGFRMYWTWKSRRQCVGRPPVDKEIRKKGLAKIIDDDEDKRVRRIQLTPKGKKALAEVRKIRTRL